MIDMCSYVRKIDDIQVCEEGITRLGGMEEEPIKGDGFSGKGSIKSLTNLLKTNNDN